MTLPDRPASFQRLAFVLPCFGLDDFPTRLDEELAADMHAAWTCLWHPVLLATANAIPEWKRADGAALDIESAIIVCPQASESKVDVTIRERLELHNCIWIPSQSKRQANLENIATKLGMSLESSATSSMIQQLFALGYAYLQLQLLTRRLRYSSNMDQPLFVEQTLEAAKAASRGDEAEFERWIQSAFDQLAQDRDHYYSQSAYLIDLTLLAKSTLGASLQRQLAQPGQQNILANADLLQQLRSKSSENFEALRAANREGKLSLIGGLESDLPLAYLSNGSFRRALSRGAKAYDQLGLNPPKVFAEFQSFIPPDAPKPLRNFGFQGAILNAFAPGSYPEGRQAKITWESSDGSGLDTIAHHIVDGSSANSFLALGAKLGEQLDYHQVPTLVIAHWPGIQHDCWDDFLIVTNRIPALGIWKSVDEYFSTTQRPYHQDRLNGSDFKPPAAPVTNATISSFASYSKQNAAVEGATALEVLARQVDDWLNRSRNSISAAADQSSTGVDTTTVTTPLLTLDIEPAASAVDCSLNPLFALESATAGDEKVDSDRLRSHLERWTSKFQQCLPRNKKSSVQDGLIIFNPYSGPLRCYLRDIAGSFTPSEESRVYACHTSNGKSSVVVDVPPLGIARIAANGSASAGGKARGTMIAQVDNLVNEFFESHLHQERGYLKAIYLNNKRGNRASGMLMLGGLGSEAESKIQMKCDRLEILESNPVVGRMRAKGRLLDNDTDVLEYQLDYTLWRGSRILEIDGSISNLRLGKAKYLGWRWAWPTSTAILSTWHQGTKVPFGPLAGYAPLAVEVDDAENKLVVLSSNLPVMRKPNDRFLESIISFTDSPSIQFRLGLSVNSPRPYQTSQEWAQPGIVIPDSNLPLSVGSAAWFIQANMPNLAIQPVECLLDLNQNIVGLRIQLQETEGKSGTAKVRCFRSIESADRVDHHGTSLGKLVSEDDSFTIAVRANELSQVDIRWKRA